MGRDKAGLRFGPETLLGRVIRQLAEACGPVAVVAAAGQGLPAFGPGVVVVRDPVADLGPLPALGAGLAALPDGVELAYAAGTDAPWLEPGWVDALVGEAEGHDAAVVVDADGRPHPLGAVYRVGPARAAIAGLIADGRDRLRDLVDVLATRRVPAERMRRVDPNLRTLRNLNTPEAYRAALGEFDAGAAGQAGDPGP